MAERLHTVAGYIHSVRRLIKDMRRPYRYADDDLVEALNMALLEARRIRADLFVTRWGNTVPAYEGVSDQPVPIEPQFRRAFVYGIAWQTLEEDEEDVQDARANSFMAKFQSTFTGVQQPPVQGGTPAPQNPKQ
jgi:hypothetical protein